MFASGGDLLGVGRGEHGQVVPVRPWTSDRLPERCLRGHDLAVAGVSRGWHVLYHAPEVRCGLCLELRDERATWCLIDPREQRDEPELGVVLVATPPPVRGGIGRITVHIGHHAVGDVDIAVCGPCGRACLEQIRVDERFWRLGVGRLLVSAALARLQAAICEAMASAGITLEQAAVIGQTALGEAKSNPVGYVTDAFRRHLSRRLRSLVVEPLSDNPLPLLNKPKRQVGATKRAKQAEGAAAGTDAGEAAKMVLPACSTCDAREGEQYPAARTVTGDDGREHPCPDCLPPAA